MATTKTLSQAEIDRQLAGVRAAHEMAGEKPTTADIDAARRILSGEASVKQVIAEGLAELEAEYRAAQ
ncbi:hypothetical protein [Glutamicibacter sp. NPDC087344]|uniref:hypothetical protein n=1 Tax=Glutamicibacter sp. NPDC087344 TaxID=3363994 RepID=UPI003802D8A0